MAVLIGQRAVNTLVTIGYSTNNNTANSPEHLQHLGARGSQLDRHDLATVRRRIGNKDAPRNALENLGRENYRH